MDRLRGSNRRLLIPAAWLLDQVAGDPEWLPHPVRLIGLAISRGELALRRPGQSKQAELLSGGALTLAVVTATYYATRQLIRRAKHQSPSLGDMAELLLAWTCLAARNLEQEAAAVISALDSGSIAHARHRLARIVGRDTQHLNTAEICRATIETIAESASDGILAPLFYMAVGGMPLAMAYKAINTMDSMIGHADERYFFFGKAAARLDDAANYLPARLTAGLIVAASGLQGSTNPRAAWRTWRRDGGKHKSPNAGPPESAMAGALEVQLGGENTYAGELVRSRRIGQGFVQPSLPQAKVALRLVSFVTLLGVACATLLSAAIPRGASEVSR
jgi:adenosylcobinamide-phosphate synthase